MSLFDHPKPNEIDNWVCIFESSTDYEVELARNYLANLNIPSNILSKKDSAYSLGVGEMALIYLYVPAEFEKGARKALSEFNDIDVDEDPEDGEAD